MNIRGDRRGLSPVIASVLLIVMVVSLVALIFSWARGYVVDQTSDIPTGKICGEIDFSAELFLVGGTSYNLEIVNKGNVNISSFEMKTSFGGNSNIEKIPAGVLAGKSIGAGISLIAGQHAEVAGVLVEYDGKPLRDPVVCWDNAVELDY
jgi:flagellin-like protein